MDRKIMHRIWTEMKKRCDDPSHLAYKKYGALGIGYQSSWEEFENFCSDMKTDYPSSLVLSRRDSNDDYTKDNCFWTDILNPDLVVGNYKVPNKSPKIKPPLEKLYFYKGEVSDTAGFSRKYDIDYTTLKKRLDRGWSIERALSEPTHKRKENNKSK